MLRESDLKWNAIAYVNHFSDENFSTKYQSYKAVLKMVSVLYDDSYYKKIYGTDYYFSHFFSECYAETEMFEEMLLTIENENIDKVFILSMVFETELMSRLCKLCRERNIEIMYVPVLKDNIAHKEFFDMYANLAS